MSVGSGVPYNAHTGNGLTTVFAYGFTLLDAADLVVTIDGVVTSAYTVSGIGVAAGGSITFSSAPANGAAVLLRRVIQLVRSTEYPTNGDLLAETVNGDFDRLWMAVQNTDSDGTRSIRVPEIGVLAELPAAAARADKLLSFDSAGNPSVAAPSAGTATALAVDLLSTASGRGASMVSMTSTFTDEEGMSVTDAINGQPQISVLRFMTDAQRADYLARTAVNDFASALDLTTPIQTAIYVTYAEGVWLYFPDGAAKVTGLEGPTTTALYEDRGDAWRMFGTGSAQPFVRYPIGGAVLISDTDAPVFRYRQRRSMPTAGGNTQIRGLRFEQRNAAATAPVVLWDSMSENADFTENMLLQFGTGHGFEVTYQIKGNIERNFALYGGYFTSTRSVAGIGFNIPSAADAGMLTLRKNSARSFLWGYVHGDGTNDSSGALFVQNECSDCTNGVWNKAGCTAATFHKTYTEGVTGTCIKDEGTMTTITGGMHYLGFAIGIDASATSNYGTKIEGNYLECAAACKLIAVGSGGPNKTVRGNHLLFSTSGGSVTNVIGIEITGLNPRLDVSANAFLPRGAWTGGAGTVKILDSATGGLIGSLPLPSGADLEIPSLLRGAVTYQQAASALTQTDVNGSNVLALPDANSALATASAGCTVTALSQSATFTDGVREVSIRTTNANMSFQDSATLELAGGAAFTGPGILTLQVEVIGGTVYGFEKSRVVF